MKHNKNEILAFINEKLASPDYEHSSYSILDIIGEYVQVHNILEEKDIDDFIEFVLAERMIVEVISFEAKRKHIVSKHDVANAKFGIKISATDKKSLKDIFRMVKHDV